MLKSTITLLRDYFQNTGIKIMADNAKLYDSTSQFTTLVWDDTNELLYSFRPNNSHYNQDKKKMIIDVTEYVNVEYMSADVSREEMISILQKMKTAGTVTDSVINEIITSYDKLNNKLL